MSGLRIQVFEDEQLMHTADCDGPVALGRQAEGEAGPYSMRKDSSGWRLVLARIQEIDVSRKHVSLELLPGSRVRVTNWSRVGRVRLQGGDVLNPGTSRDLPLPTGLQVGSKTVSVQEESPAETAREPSTRRDLAPPDDFDRDVSLQSLSEATLPPEAAGRRRFSFSAPLVEEMQPDSLVQWLEAAMDVLQSAVSSSDFFEKAARALVNMINLDCGQVLLRKEGIWTLQARMSAPHHTENEERSASRHILDRVSQERRTLWHAPAQNSGASLTGVKAVVAAPILSPGGEVIGALYGVREGYGTVAKFAPISRIEALLVQLLAGGVASGLVRLEREQADLERRKRLLQYEGELDIGRKIQEGFLPEALPDFHGWEVRAHFQPAREVAGDFYDAFPLSSRHVGLVIADVCDKGVGAALFMALFRSLIRAISQQSMGQQLADLPDDLPLHDPRTASRRRGLLVDLNVLTTVELTNKYVSTTHASACMFATLFFGILDTVTGTVTYVNAGHDAPTVVGPQGIKQRLETTGPAVGVVPAAAYDIARVTLEAGDMLVAHTDGVNDARDAAGQSFSEERLLALLKQPATSAEAVMDRIKASLGAHIGNAVQFDDITLMAVRRR